MVWALEVGMRLVRTSLKVFELPYVFLFLPLYRRFLQPQANILMTKTSKRDEKAEGGGRSSGGTKQSHSPQNKTNSAVTSKATPAKMANQRHASYAGGGPSSHPAYLDRTSTDTSNLNFSSMPLKEKRKYYACGDKYVTSDDLPRWDSENEIVNPSLTILEKLEVQEVDVELNNKICLIKQDITRLELDAIVNAANERMLGGGGVDGSIHRAAGPQLKEECRKVGGCPTGEARITSGHKLPAKHVIHTVGPMNRSEKALRSCYDNCFKIMLEQKLRSIAFCCISTGIYGYPNDEAANVALEVTREYLSNPNHRNKIDLVVFCCFLDTDFRIYKELLSHVYFPKQHSCGGEEATSSQPRQPTTDLENMSSPEAVGGNEDGSPSDQELNTEIPL